MASDTLKLRHGVSPLTAYSTFTFTFHKYTAITRYVGGQSVTLQVSKPVPQHLIITTLRSTGAIAASSGDDIGSRNRVSRTHCRDTITEFNTCTAHTEDHSAAG